MFNNIIRIVEAPSGDAAKLKFMSDCRKKTYLRDAPMASCYGYEINILAVREILPSDIIR